MKALAPILEAFSGFDDQPVLPEELAGIRSVAAQRQRGVEHA